MYRITCASRAAAAGRDRLFGLGHARLMYRVIDPYHFPGHLGIPCSEAEVRAANESPDYLRDVIITYARTLSGLGQITVGAAPGQAGNPAEILFPPALLRRAARYIGGTADLAANGGKLPDGIPGTARSQLAVPCAGTRTD
jgi:hypothetical protein